MVTMMLSVMAPKGVADVNFRAMRNLHPITLSADLVRLERWLPSLCTARKAADNTWPSLER